MPTGYGALCTDFFINQKLSLRMDLPSERETILSLFDRIRRERPRMNRLRRYEGELALESPDDETIYEWLALRRTSIRSGSVNPETTEDAWKLHRTILRVAPFFLTISPLDIEAIDLVYGFDFEVEANRNDLVFDALMAESPLAKIIDHDRESLQDCQPFISFALDDAGDLQAHVELKTRVRHAELRSGRYERGPLTLYCTIRKTDAVDSVDELPELIDSLGSRLEQLVDDRVIPHVLRPLREVILSRPG